MKFKLLFTLACASVYLTELVAADQKVGAATPAAKEATKVKLVSVEEFDKLRANKANIVLDVRTPDEFKAGHIPGATNIDYTAPDFGEKVARLDKDKTYLVHCAAGSRSARACKKLEGLGFKNLVDLHAGFNGWEGAGKPVEK
jgi:rhodanese-related sulfurtransferase